MSKKALFILVAAFAVSSCATVEWTEGLESRAEKLNDEKSTRRDFLDLPQVSLSFLVRNKTQLKSSCIAAVTIIPIQHGANQNRRMLEGLAYEGGFLVEIGIKPKVENFAANFRSIYLKYGGETIQPTKLLEWNGGPECESLPAMNKQSIGDDVGIAKSSRLQCFMLSYPISTIPPEEHFSLEVDGIKIGNQKVDVPAISFAPKAYKEQNGYGERGC